MGQGPSSGLAPSANCKTLHVKAGSDDDSAVSVLPPGLAQQAGLPLTSTLVMSQSLTALLWTPLVTIWKPLAVAVWRSTEDEGGRVSLGWRPRHPNTPDPQGSVYAMCVQN